jgi:hypothetical protein
MVWNRPQAYGYKGILLGDEEMKLTSNLQLESSKRKFNKQFFANPWFLYLHTPSTKKLSYITACSSLDQ